MPWLYMSLIYSVLHLRCFSYLHYDLLMVCMMGNVFPGIGAIICRRSDLQFYGWFGHYQITTKQDNHHPCVWFLRYNIVRKNHYYIQPLRWRHNDHAGVSNHQPHGCLLNRLFRRKSKKTSKLRVTGLCAGNSPGTGEFPAQMASYAENVSIWWRHHGLIIMLADTYNNNVRMATLSSCQIWYIIATIQSTLK